MVAPVKAEMVRMAEQIPSDVYRDSDGTLRRDRRRQGDRRNAGSRGAGDSDRRHQPRRAADREFVEREHHAMIEEALAEFADEHEAF